MSKMIPGKNSVVYHVRLKRRVPKLTINRAIESVPREEYKLLKDSAERVNSGKVPSSESVELLYNIGRGNVKVEMFHPVVDHTIAIGYDYKIQNLVVAYARPRNGVDTFNRQEGSVRSLARLEKAIYGNKNGTEVPRFYIGHDYESVPSAIRVPITVDETLKASVEKALLFFKHRTIKYVTVYTYDEKGQAVLIDYTQKLFGRPTVIEIPDLVSGTNALLEESWESGANVDALTLRQQLPTEKDVTGYLDTATALLNGVPAPVSVEVVELSQDEKKRAFDEAGKNPLVIEMQNEFLKTEIAADPALAPYAAALAPVAMISSADKMKIVWENVDKVVNPATGNPYTRTHYAKEFGVSPPTIGNWISAYEAKRAADKPKRVVAPKPLKKAIKASIVKSKKAHGWSVAELASFYDVSKTSIYSMLK